MITAIKTKPDLKKPNSAQNINDFCWWLTLVFACFICITLLSDTAVASVITPGAGSGGNVIGQVFCNIVGMFTGITGKTLATIAIIAVGVGALFGKVSWGMAFIVALGVALIFGAASIVTNLGGDSTPCISGTASIT